MTGSIVDNQDENVDFSEYTYVFASTLNQLVNYIPLMKYKFVENLNVTLFKEESYKTKLKENEEWDQNLLNASKSQKIKDIPIPLSSWLNTDKIVKIFQEKLDGKKVFWNITGGQRPFVLAVLYFVQDRPDDKIAYLEGNSGIIAINNYNFQKSIQRVYEVEANFTMQTAFQLMGFKTQTKFESPILKKEEIDFWMSFYEKYKESEPFRINLVSLNKKKHKDGIDISEAQKAECWDKIYSDLKTPENYLDKFRIKSKNQFPFGYILEEMCFHVLYRKFKDQVKIYYNVNAYSDHQNGSDQFDILILTKQGQIINIECKSGFMDGDVAKSTKFSTYAIAGVYGKPILITPLLEKHIGSHPFFESSNEAKSNADRVGLNVWGIDCIVNKLKDLITLKI